MTPAELRFDKALEVVLGIEGGYSNDARDAGGATQWGISLRFARLLAQRSARRWLRQFDQNGDLLITPSDMRALPKRVALEVYREEFWQRYRCDELPWPASMLYFSYVVNMPASVATKILQRAIARAGGGEIIVDGRIGPQTLGAAHRCDPAELCKRLEAEASEHYADLGDSQPHYEAGWQYRSADVLWAAASEVCP